jgi:hypothetical protein
MMKSSSVDGSPPSTLIVPSPVGLTGVLTVMASAPASASMVREVLLVKSIVSWSSTATSPRPTALPCR